MNKRGKSSNIWLARQHNDIYTKKSKQHGYRSRAVYKLLEIQQKYQIFKPHSIIVDLGAAPGGWSQLAVEYVGKSSKIIAVDILPIAPIEGVNIIRGDFTKKDTIDQISKLLLEEKIDLVICDMAPNFSGISDVDQSSAVYLSELVLNFVKMTLKGNGSFLIKLFQGEGFDEYIQELKNYFANIVIKKPKASHSESREIYILARKFQSGSPPSRG